MTPAPAPAGAGVAAGSAPRRAPTIAAIALCGLFELWALIVYSLHFARWPWQDWIVYYGAARLYLNGHLPVLLNADNFTAYLNTAFAAWLPRPFTFRSWVYPPPFLLLVLPFGMLPFALSCLLFQFATLGTLIAALWRWTKRRRGFVVAAVVLSPPAAFNFGTGQNGFLTTALLVAGFGLIERRPRLAGGLLGLLTYKPQFWPLAALALIAARHWRGLIAAIATAALVALLSLAVCGAAAWRAWLDWLLNPPAADYQSFVRCCLLHDESVATNLRLLGAGPTSAALAQSAAILLAGAAVWRAFRQPGGAERRLAVLLAATALAAPHVANYDAVLLTLAAALLFADGGVDYRVGVGVPALAWLAQAFNPPDVFRIGALTPVLTVLLIGVALMRRNDEPGAARAWRR